MQWLRSFVLLLSMYTLLPVMGLAYLVPSIISRRAAIHGVRTYSSSVVRLADWIAGIKTEVRGPVPNGAVLIAAKHQSFFDILVLVSKLERPRFIMKRELVWAPVLGWYALRIGCVPVIRGKRGQAIRKMLDDVKAGQAEPGQLIIYPQGTRVAPGSVRAYKIGAGLIYRDLGQDCVPVAVNVGLFWPKSGILKTPGKAIVEFMDPIAPGLDPEVLVKALETSVEERSNALMKEARFG